jgi:3D (Asp-Asp-Asp) domain-containing protein
MRRLETLACLLIVLALGAAMFWQSGRCSKAESKCSVLETNVSKMGAYCTKLAGRLIKEKKENSKLRRELHAAERRRRSLPSRSMTVWDWRRWRATAYCCGTRTATGTRATEGRTIAVDPHVIPLGSRVRVEVPSFPDRSGWYVAEDTGGAIKGKIIDIRIKSCRGAVEFGRRPIVIKEVVKP